ncbi:MAG TPA: signal peptidase I [Candidatus Levybacteria bacterium]|nr:signal peptidase I [Candidatus Levybacteria bacterium]
MKKMKYIKNGVYTIVVLLILMIGVLLVAGRFGIGGVRALVVQSGSMEPTIPTKSVVLTVPVHSYSTGDVITFKQSGRDAVLVTHRIVSVEQKASDTQFTTKGDANEEADGETVSSQDVIGKVLFSVPFVGSIVSFAQTQIRFLLLAIIPAVAIVYSEILSIKKQTTQYMTNRKAKKAVQFEK